jgi:hypothetical protein
VSDADSSGSPSESCHPVQPVSAATPLLAHEALRADRGI